MKAYTKSFFLLAGSLKKKIKVIFQDSKKLDISNFKNKFDLIFIDGGHTYSCVKNDTEKSFEMVKNNGLIFWHDYNPMKRSASDVVKYLDEISDKHNIFHIKRTHMCFLRYNK